MMRVRGMFLVGVAALLVASADKASAEKINLEIASAHNASWHFIQITQNYFIPEVKDRTTHDVEFTEGFAGAMGEAEGGPGRTPVRHHRHRVLLLP